MELEKIVVASGNKGKITEIKAIFTGVEIVSMQELGFDGDSNVEPRSGLFRQSAGQRQDGSPLHLLSNLFRIRCMRNTGYQTVVHRLSYGRGNSFHAGAGL